MSTPERPRRQRPLRAVRRPRNTEAGLAVVNAVFDGLGIEAEWSDWNDRGFVWWPNRHGVHVWSDPAETHPDGTKTWLVHVETPCLDGLDDVDADPRFLDAYFSAFASRLTMTSLIVDEGRLLLHLSAVVHAQNAAWVPLLLQPLVVSQARVASNAARLLANDAGLRASESEHPDRGLRSEPDPLLVALDDVPDDLADWSHAEFGRAADQLVAGGVVASASVDSLVARLPVDGDEPFGEPHVTLDVRTQTDERHDKASLKITLRLPHWPRDRFGNQVYPVDLNHAEAAGESGVHLVGTWAADANHPESPPYFTATMHPATFQPGLLVNLVVALALRSTWVSELLGPPPLPEPDRMNDFLEFLDHYLAATAEDEDDDVGEVDENEIERLVQKVAERIRHLGPDNIRTVVVDVMSGEYWVGDVSVEVDTDDDDHPWSSESVDVFWSVDDLEPAVGRLAELIDTSFAIHFDEDGNATRGVIL